MAENQSLKSDLDELAERLLETRLASLANDTHEKNGDEWLVGTVEAVGPNAVSDRVDALADETADVVALAGSDGSTFVVGTDGETDANDVTDELGGSG